MARIELPSGAWIEYRTDLIAADKFAVQDAIVLTVNADGMQEVTGGLQNKMRNALLKQIITGWSYDQQGIPIPAMNGAGAEVIGNVMSIKDYNALTDEVQQLLEEVSYTPPNQQSSS